MSQTDEQIKALYAEATGYARSLAAAITHKHFPENTEWKPLPDLIGILTQIDNATCGLVRAPAPLAQSTEEVEAIRARHEAADKDSGHEWAGLHADHAHTDRATLLRLLDAARAELAEVAEIKAAAKKVGLELRFPREKEGTYQVHWRGSFDDWAALAAALQEQKT